MEIVKSSINDKKRGKKTKNEEAIDILSINDQILANFEKEKQCLTQYAKNVSELSTILISSKIPEGISIDIINDIKKLSSYVTAKDPKDLTVNEYIQTYNKLCFYILKIKNINSGIIVTKYTDLSKTILDKYAQLISIPIKTSFMGKKTINPEVEAEKNMLISEYVHICKDFINIKISHIENNKTNIVCGKCGNKSEFEETESEITCESCGAEIPKMTIRTNFRDSDRINLQQKFTYDKKSYFKETLIQYQGKQNKDLDELTFDIKKWLDKQCIKYSDTKKSHIRLYLEEVKRPKNYDDQFLLHFKITGIPCHDISHIENAILEDFSLLEKTFLELDIQRKNILNKYYILRQLLIRRGEKIDLKDFPGLKSKEVQIKHDDIYQKICEKLSWNFVQTIL